VLAMHQALIAVDHGYAASEAAHGLRQFQADVAAADDHEMLGNLIELECLDVGERLRVRETVDIFQQRARAGANDDVGSAELTRGAIRKRNLHGPGSYEAPGAENE